jgi:hypothetical protein
MARMLYHRETAAHVCRRLLTLALFAVAAVAASAQVASAQTQGSPDLVISQVYTRGGESGATFRNDYVEVFNRGSVAVNLLDYTLQVLVNAPARPGFPGGLAPVSIRFASSGDSVPLEPGRYVLYQFGSGGNNGAPLPFTPDADNPLLDLPAAAGRVALIKGRQFTQPYAQYGCAVGVDAALADFVSYGAATCAEGAGVLPAPTVTIPLLRSNDGCDDTDNNLADFARAAAPNPRNTSSPARLCNLTAPASTFQFEAAANTVAESSRFAEIFVTRAGDASGAASVQYATGDETATERTDYTTALDTLSFAPGETRKSFRVLITDDERVESSNEALTLSLNYPTNGAGLGTQHISRLTITDNSFGFPTNPIDDTDYFVVQHYADFLSRQPDVNGFLFWTGEIKGCGADAQCKEVKRINVSAAFFLSIEFQETGFYAYRAYRAAFPDSSSRLRGFPLYRELWRDAQRIGHNIIVVPNNGWEGQLATNKRAYALEFVQRPEFLIRYPQNLTAAQFVDNLNATAGNPLSQAERDQQVANLTAANNGTAGRAAVLAAVIDDTDFRNAEFNRAFVLAEYFGYMRRNPFDTPDTDFAGYDFWLGKLNQFNGNYIQAEMVKAFISSDEYRNRFVQ